MKHKILFSLILLITGASPLFAQNPALRDSAVRNKYDFPQFGRETWSFVKQPTRWEGSDYPNVD